MVSPRLEHDLSQFEAGFDNPAGQSTPRVVSPGRLRSLFLEQRQAVVSSAWSLGLRIAGLVSTFALGIILARALGPTEFGVYGLVIALAVLVMNVALLGTPQLAVRELSIRSARADWSGVKGVIYKFGIATTVTAIAFGIVALIAVELMGDRVGVRERLLVFQAALLTPLMTLTALFAAQLRGLGALNQGQILDILVRPAGVFIGALIIVLIGWTMTAPDVLWLQILVTAITAGVSYLWISRALPNEAKSVPRNTQFKWLRYALPLAAVDALRQLDGVYGLVLMGWFASGVELGVFRVAVSCGALIGLPLTVLHVVFAPTVSRMNEFERKEELQNFLSLGSAAVTAILAVITLASWFLGKPAIELVFGAVYGDAWLPLFLLCIAQSIFAFFGMGPILLAMCNGERYLTKVYALAVGLALVSAIPLTKYLGAPGAAGATIISAILIGTLSRRYARKNLGVDVTFLPLLYKQLARRGEQT